MAQRQRRAAGIDWKEAVQSDDAFRELLKQVVQEVLEAEMEETVTILGRDRVLEAGAGTRVCSIIHFAASWVRK